MKRIHKIGVELEGGWNRPISGLHSDGSIHDLRADRIGEISSLPTASRTNMKDWIRDVYPDVSNRTCGYHVHVSVKKRLDYMRLMDKDFYDAFLVRMEAWGKEMFLPQAHPFWERLRGENRFCRRLWNSDVQSSKKHKDEERYSQLNFAYAMHGTMECRLFPMFETSDLACKALDCLCDLVESYLKSCRREKVFKARVSWKEIKSSLPRKKEKTVLDVMQGA